MPAISVVIPYFNAQDTLYNAIQSILNQSFKDFECILVDNNSTDQSLQIAQDIKAKDSRIILAHEPQQGVSHASVLGSSMAQSPYIARMDADDISYPNRLALQYECLQKNKHYGAVGGLVHFGGDKTTASGLNRFVEWNNQIISNKEILLNRFVEAPIINPTAMWRKDIEIQFGGYRHGNFPEDYELWLRWLQHGVQFTKVPHHILRWNDSEGRLTRNDNRYSIDAFYKIKAYYLSKWLQEFNPLYPHVYIWGAGRQIRKRVRFLSDEGISVTGYIDISHKRQISENLIYYKDLPPPNAAFIIVFMPHQDIKKEIIDFLHNRGFIAGVHYILAA